jgi:hypothetical protein
VILGFKPITGMDNLPWAVTSAVLWSASKHLWETLHAHHHAAPAGLRFQKKSCC